jgi:hypothetical protein
MEISDNITLVGNARVKWSPSNESMYAPMEPMFLTDIASYSFLHSSVI